MLLFIVQTEFLQRKESKNQDKPITNGESFEKAKLHYMSCSGRNLVVCMAQEHP